MAANQSIQRAFSILKCVAEFPEGVGVMEIARELDLHKSTVSRMLSTLELEGAVERNESGYIIGQTLETLTAGSSWPDNLIRRARPVLQELAEATGETINLALPDALDRRCARYVFQIDSSWNLQIRDWTDNKIPLHGCVDGKVMLARRPAEQIESYLTHPLEQFTANTITNTDDLRSHLEIIRERGYAFTDGEYETGIFAVSMPVFDDPPSPKTDVTFCVGGAAFRFPKGPDLEQLITLMQSKREVLQKRLETVVTNYQ